MTRYVDRHYDAKARIADLRRAVALSELPTPSVAELAELDQTLSRLNILEAGDVIGAIVRMRFSGIGFLG